MTTKSKARAKTVSRADPVATAVAARQLALAAKETPSPSKDEAIEPKEAAPPKRKTVNVSLETLAKAMAIKEKVTIQLDEVFKPAIHPKAVMDAVGNKSMAMDENITSIVSWAANMEGSSALEGTQFLGYAHLAQMSQRAEYRRPVEILANEMTRKWIKITSTSDGKDQQGEGDDRNTKVKQIEAEFKKFKVKDKFRKALEHDGFFGRGHIYVDVAPENADKSELDKSIGNGTNSMTTLKVTKGSLRGFRVVEPVWCYPLGYNTSDPLHPDWYKPSEWMVQGRTIHTTRLVTIVGREVSDLLKPAYSFGGLSLTQMLKPYVDNWLRTRQSVSDLVNKFSVSGVKMNLGDLLGVNDEQIFRRVKFYNAVKSNSGMMLLDKDTEEYFQVSTPLSGLESLQAQSQEHMASVSGVPLVKLFGIQPTGLNATSDGELECFYTWVHSLQESMIDDPLRFILNLVQLHLYGEIDPGIDFEFVNLDALTEEEEEELNSKKAATDKTLIEAGVLDKSESRKRVASDPNSPYASLDANKLPVAAVNEADKAGATAQEVGAIATIFDTGLLSEKSALAMFDGVGQRTGVFRIPAQDITNASDEPPAPEVEGDMPPGMEGGTSPPGEEGDDGGDPPAPDQDEAQDSAGGVKIASPIVRLAQVMRRRKARIAQDEQGRDPDGRFAPGSGNGSIKDKHGNEYSVVHSVDFSGRHQYDVVDANKENGYGGHVAGATLRKDKPSVSSTLTRVPYQRKGIATALYDHIEKHQGQKLQPNAALTDDGQAFWRARQSKVAQDEQGRDNDGRFSPGNGVSVSKSGDIHHEGQKVGRLKVDDEPHALRLASIELSPAHQGKGIGSAVIKAVQAHGQNTGRPVTLTPDAARGKEAMERQTKLYNSLGFQENKGSGAVTDKVGKKTFREAMAWHPNKDA